MKKTGIAFMLSAFMLGGAVMSHAAETVHLYLKSEKIKRFNPEVPSGILQALCTNENVLNSRRPSGLATGRRTYEPIVFRKRIDKSTPLLARALQEKLPLQGEMYMYKTLPNGDVHVSRKATFKEFTISKQSELPVVDGQAPWEEIAFVFHTITWTVIDKTFPKDQWKTGYPSN